MSNKTRLNKLEESMNGKEATAYVITPFSAKGEEVIVYCNKERSTMSREDFDLLDVDENQVTEITIELI